MRENSWTPFQHQGGLVCRLTATTVSWSTMPSIIESEGSELGNSRWAPGFSARESGIGNRQVQANYLDERRMATLAAADSAKLE